MSIAWQQGPVGDFFENKNGATMEDLIQVLIDRLSYYQASSTACRENALAITKLEEAMLWLTYRQARLAKEKKS